MYVCISPPSSSRPCLSYQGGYVDHLHTVLAERPPLFWCFFGTIQRERESREQRRDGSVVGDLLARRCSTAQNW